MNTFTVVVDTPQVTEEPQVQAKEKLFIKGLPVTHTPPDGEPTQATYVYACAYGDRHYVIFGADTTNPRELIVYGKDLTPNRSLTPDEMITYLTDELAEVCADSEIRRKRSQNLYDDIAIIAERLRDEAENRGWCQEYNDLCEDLNSIMSDSHMLPLTQEYEVDIEIEATVKTVRTVTVMASSFEEAQELVLDDPDSYIDTSEEALEAASDGGFDSLDVNIA